MKKLLLLTLVGSVLVAGCGRGGEESVGWTPVSIDTLDPTCTVQYQRAVAARDAMFGELMQTLAGELGSSGPAAAIRVCRDVAPSLAQTVGDREGVRIGRTSWKLRNPANTAPEWAAALLADRPAEERAAQGPDGALGVTLPIRVGTPCLTCHGAPETIPATVRDALASSYPDDQATGFAAGDLRGWFWVEVPPSR